MGNVNCSIPTKLALELRDKFKLRAFVETGLGQGTSALWAEKNFDTVTSIEIDGAFVTRFKKDHPNSTVKIIEGDSALEMLEVASGLTAPALFWLDGHSDDYTPILAELAAIDFSQLLHVIMVDDWRLFGTLRNWPSKDKVKMFAGLGRRNIYEVDDVLVCTP